LACRFTETTSYHWLFHLHVFWKALDPPG
jgi:hypothetical protein